MGAVALSLLPTYKQYPNRELQTAGISRAMFDVEDARYQEAVPLLKRVLAEEPNIPVANMQYGVAQARLKNYAEAIPPLIRMRVVVAAAHTNAFAKKVVLIVVHVVR